MFKYNYKINSIGRSLQLVVGITSNKEILVKLFEKDLKVLEKLIMCIVCPMCSKVKVL